MNNLFSSFDPQAMLGLPLNWVSAMVFMSLMGRPLYSSSGRHSILMWAPVKFVKGELGAISSPLGSPGFSIMGLCLFFFILVNNSLGLLPHVFTASSHLAVALALGLPLWVGHMALGAWGVKNLMIAHLVPLGSPAALSPFMVLVELVSNFIRPLTLSVRLVANMIAGHLLMALLGGLLPLSGWAVCLALMPLLILLLTLEAAVACIQSFVFSILCSLYIQDVESPHLHKSG